MNTHRHRVACAVRALRYARTSVAATDKYDPFDQVIRWHVVARKFHMYAEFNMHEAMRSEP